MDELGNLIQKLVSELSPSDFLLSYNTKTESKNWPTFDLRKYKHLNKSHNTQNEIKFIKINNDIMRLIGFYISEGNLSKDGYKTTFTFHIKEIEYTKDIENILQNEWDIKCHHREYIYKNTRKVECGQKQLARFLLEQFNTGSKKKTLPSWFFTLPKSGFIEFLKGYAGDARFGKKELRYTSANKNLIETLAYISKLNGLDCSIVQRYNHDHLSPQKTVIKGCWCYDLIYCSKMAAEIFPNIYTIPDFGRGATNIGELIDSKVCYSLGKCKSDKKSVSKNNKKIHGKHERLDKIIAGDLHIVRIKSIAKLDDTIYVYDLHVPNNQMFFGGNYPILLHNSEMFGDNHGINGLQNEETPFQPISPYAVSKVAAYHLTRNYRIAYDLFCCGGITFNMDSERRTPEFVTKKITQYIGKLKCVLDRAYTLGRSFIPGKDFPKLKLGNLDSSRDWSHPRDTVKAMWMMLQSHEPKDYVISSGQTHTIREFLTLAFSEIDISDWHDYVEVDREFLRPSDVTYLKGDNSKIRTELKWCPQISFEQLVKDMVRYDINDQKSKEK